MKKILLCLFFLFLFQAVYSVSCSDVPVSVLNGKTCVEVSSCIYNTNGPVELNNAYYLVVNDLQSGSASCFSFHSYRGSGNLVIDLNGHSITYGIQSGANAIVLSGGSGPPQQWINNIIVKNGKLITGGSNAGTAIAFYITENLEISNIEFQLNGINSSALYGDILGKVDVHDNNVLMNVTVSNPCSHYTAYPVINLRTKQSTGAIKVYKNMITGKGSMGIGLLDCGTGFAAPAEIYDNNIQMYSWHRDGYGILVEGLHGACSGGTKIYDNYIKQVNGRGIMIAGWDGDPDWGPQNIEIYGNYVEVQEGPSCEGNSNGNSYGLRIRFGVGNVNVHNNIFIGHAGTGLVEGTTTASNGSSVNVVQIDSSHPYGQNIIFHDNIVSADSNATVSNAGQSIYAVGVYVAGEGTTTQNPPPMSYYYNNTITSNHVNITSSPLGSGGPGSNAIFTSNTLIKGPNPRSDYHSIYAGYWDYNFTGLEFIDTIVSNGASVKDWHLMNISYRHLQDVNILWYLTVNVKDSGNNPVQNALIQATPKDNSTTFSGTTDVTGKFKFTLSEMKFKAYSNILAPYYLSPYSLRISKTGYNSTDQNIILDSTKTLNVSLSLSGPCVNGSIQGCVWGVENCDGIQTCSGGVWGACNDVLGDNCPAACVENWFCGLWSACVNGTQTRTCTDLNSCGTQNNKPIEVQSCGDCTNGTTQDCITTQSCPGTQFCSNNVWGSCIDALNDGCPSTGEPGTPLKDFNVLIEPQNLTEGQDFTITISFEGTPIQNAKINYANKSYYTNTKGKVTLKAQTEYKTLTASKTDYNTKTITLNIQSFECGNSVCETEENSITCPTDCITPLKKMNIIVTEIDDLIEVKIIDEQANPVADAQVNYATETKNTNTQGITSFIQFPQQQTITATKTGYETISLNYYPDTKCTTGQKQNCSTTENCQGTQICTNGNWSTCNDTPGDQCPTTETDSGVTAVLAAILIIGLILTVITKMKLG